LERGDGTAHVTRWLRVSERTSKKEEAGKRQVERTLRNASSEVRTRVTRSVARPVRRKKTTKNVYGRDDELFVKSGKKGPPRSSRKAETEGMQEKKRNKEDTKICSTDQVT